MQDAIRELQKKLSVQIVKANTVGSATIYEVFSCEDILTKRRNEGLVWVRRFGTRRADLLDNPEEKDGFTPIGSPPTGLTDTAVGVTPTDPIGPTPTGGIGVTPIQVVKEASSKKETSSLRSSVWQALIDYGLPDEEAVSRLLTGIRAVCPDANDAEILHFIAAKGALIHRRGSKIENPLGFLVSSVPKCFEGHSSRQYRLHHARQMEQGPESQSNDKRETERYQSVLDDPEASEAEKRLAFAVLAKA
ncbi:MAG: hypothetical protein M3Y72_03575 [Acidobacteriota bacterium]|nr:hypothetical protein [Acidobacteriota bacterium]